MLKKLISLIKNYDKIMELINNSNVKPESVSGKTYSTFNTPQSQIDYIYNKGKGD